MEQQDLRTLKILEAVDKEESPSQRDMARQLNVSLGLVNSFVKRLVNKGYFKVKTIPRNRVRYILTPKGAAEKTRLTYEYIQYSLQFFKDARQKLKGVFRQFEEDGVRKIAFFGAGDLAEIAYISLQETGMSLAAVFDDAKRGRTFFGLDIAGVEAASHAGFDIILVTVSEGADRIAVKLVEAGVPAGKVALIEQPLSVRE